MIAVEARIVDCDQGSGQWLQARLGCVTSSRIADVVAKRKRVSKPKKGDESAEPPKPEELACRYNMRMELACELLSGRASEHFVSKWMKEGKENEPLARAEYELRYDVWVKQIGLIYHGSVTRAGASLDGLVGDDGIVEFKCPKIETHAQYMAEGVIPEEYLPQMTWQLACYETRQWNDFVSYCPAMPERYQIFRKRLERTKEVDDLIRGMEAEVIQFNSEVDELLRRIKG